MKHAPGWGAGPRTQAHQQRQSSAEAVPAACGRSFSNATDGSFSLRIVYLRFGESVPCAVRIQKDLQEISGL